MPAVVDVPMQPQVLAAVDAPMQPLVCAAAVCEQPQKLDVQPMDLAKAAGQDGCEGAAVVGIQRRALATAGVQRSSSTRA